MELGDLKHIVSVFSALSYKIVTLIIGYLIVKLGYKLLVTGVKGKFKFKGNYQGAKADLASSSPGLLFLLLGVFLLITSVVTKVSVWTEVIIPVSEQNSEKTVDEFTSQNQEKPPLPTDEELGEKGEIDET